MFMSGAALPLVAVLAAVRGGGVKGDSGASGLAGSAADRGGKAPSAQAPSTTTKATTSERTPSLVPRTDRVAKGGARSCALRTRGAGCNLRLVLDVRDFSAGDELGIGARLAAISSA